MKKFFGILGLGCLLSMSVLFAQPKVYSVRAEETPIVETTEEQAQTSLTDEITQTCKDCIVFIKEFLSQPLVIGGVATTVGALALLIISKAISGISRKKILGVKNELEELKTKIADSVSKNDFNSLLKQKDELIEILEKVIPTIKNIKVKNECLKLLEELKPIQEEVINFVEEEKEKVIEDTKVETEKVSNDIADILKK